MDRVYLGSVDLNSDPHAHVANDLLSTEPSLQSKE